MLDLSRTALDQAAENFQSEKVAIPKLVCANALQSGLPDESFDCIYNIGVLEHFEDPSTFLRETFRLLAPGGMIFMVIVPKMPFANSMLCRFLFYPWLLVKYVLGNLVGGRKKHPKDDMIRTRIGSLEYVQRSQEIGFHSVQCVPYNPYHRVCHDGPYLNRWVLGWYRIHHHLMQAAGRVPRLKVARPFALCWLLTATKS